MMVQHILLIQCSVKGLIFFVHLFIWTNLGQGIFSLEVFYLFLRSNLTEFGHNLLSLLRNTSSELKLTWCQAMFFKQCMWLSENIKNALKTIINFNYVILEKYSLKIWTLYQLKTWIFQSIQGSGLTHHIGWRYTFQASAISSPIS